MMRWLRKIAPIWLKRLWWPRYRRGLQFYRRTIPREALLPGFVIIGVMKGGTSALFYYLGRHPQVRLALHKEPHYFDLHFDRGLEWYKTLFPAAAPGLITGEGSPYYIFHPLAPARLREVLPDARLIALLRDPVRRAYSHYYHTTRAGLEPLSFEEAIDQEPGRLAGEVEKIQRDPFYVSHNRVHYSYLSRGQYADQIEAWRAYFPAGQMLILGSEDFFAHPQQSYDQTVTFLGLPPRPLRDAPQMNKGSYPPMSDATRQRLRDYFRPHNQRLYKLLGRDFGWDE
jgi:Sulfotransferase domain